LDEIYCYFLGAGASANALPTVKQIPDRLTAFIDKLGDWFKKAGADSSELQQASRWLLEQTKRHATIDTFAKKLFVKGELNELKRLKAVASCFFVYEQSQSPVDFRYDTLLASVIEQGRGRAIQLPDNLRFLTWNYDTQLEKAFYNFCEDDRQVMESVTFHDHVERLNGYCGTHPPGHLGTAYRAAIGDSPYDGLNAAIELFSEYTKDPNTVAADINFAWESDPPITLRKIQRVLSDTTVLIIIGYSFPFFNRQIDRVILNNMPSCRRIYVQAPEVDHNAVAERIHALRSDLPEMIFLKDVSAFYIPLDYP
jgi:hypothetical protein